MAYREKEVNKKVIIFLLFHLDLLLVHTSTLKCKSNNSARTAK